MTKLKLENIRKRYGNKDKYVINDFSLDIEEKDFVVLLGPSGCGKSTLLRMIAGIEPITEGNIYINGERHNDVPPENRGISLVFQNYALFPHMNVADNIAFGLKIRKVKKEEVQRRVYKVAEKLGLADHMKKKPSQLSGGQRQRVALARATVRDTDILLMDEPLSNLDAKLRVSMREEISRLHRSMGATTIYVTHDQLEAITMATKIIVLNHGVVQQIGSPKEIYDEPENLFVAGFIGTPNMNFFECHIKNGKLQIKGIGEDAQIDVGSVADGAYTMGIRPEDILINPESPFRHEIAVIELVGADYNVLGDLGGTHVVIRVGKDYALKEGSQIGIEFPLKKIHLFDQDGNVVRRKND